MMTSRRLRVKALSSWVAAAAGAMAVVGGGVAGLGDGVRDCARGDAGAPLSKSVMLTGASGPWTTGGLLNDQPDGKGRLLRCSIARGRKLGQE